jgi:mannose-6-phosphate isomerase-like protein (cupin superfamily)
LANQSIDRLPEGPLFWHLYSYATRAAADSARTAEPSTVVEAFGKAWRFTIANSSWRAPSGDRVAAVGPLDIPRANSYVARYMEGTFPPNRAMLTTVHRHSGPEAWYVLTGAQCLRTADKTMVLRAGEGSTVPSGPAMVLTSIGPEIRRSFVLVLHDALQPWQTNTSEWTPTSECPAQ